MHIARHHARRLYHTICLERPMHKARHMHSAICIEAPSPIKPPLKYSTAPGRAKILYCTRRVPVTGLSPMRSLATLSFAYKNVGIISPEFNLISDEIIPT